MARKRFKKEDYGFSAVVKFSNSIDSIISMFFLTSFVPWLVILLCSTDRKVISFRRFLLKLNGSKGAKHASFGTQEHINRKSAVIYDNLPMPSLPKSSVADP